MVAIPNNAARGFAPGPRGLQALRSLRDLQRDPMETLRQSLHTYGDVVRFHLGGKLSWHLFHHPDDVERVLRNIDLYPKGPFATMLIKLVTGDGIAASEGQDWLQQRRLMQPAVHRHRLALLTDTMVRATERMLERWDAEIRPEQPRDMSVDMTRLTLQIVGETLCGIDMSADADELGGALTQINDYTGYRLTHPLALPERFPTPRNRAYNRAVATFNRVVLDVIHQRQRSGEDTGDLLSMLIAARDADTGEGMSAEQLRNQVRTLLIAGHETTAAAMTWLWFLLAQHPEIEARLHAEIDTVLGGRAPTFAELQQLKYTRMVIEESMRFYPPAWIAVRQSSKDDVVRGYHIPAGSIVLYSAYVVHRHPGFWRNPDRFDPEHFSPEQTAGRPKYAYVPFSGGPRLCLGNHFTLMEMTLVLATVAQRYRLRIAPGYRMEPHPRATLRPRNGMPMLLERR